MFMFEGKRTPKEIIALVRKEIERLGGLEKAFPNNGLILLYSGPDPQFFPSKPALSIKIVGPEITNGTRTEEQKKNPGWADARRVDDTPIGNFLFVQNNLYEWLEHVHTDPATGVFDFKKQNEDAKAVMTYVSALFVRTARGHVRTAVCGARRDRVFYETEIDNLCDRDAFPPEAQDLVVALLASDDIKSINGVPIAVFRELRKKSGLEAVYDRICLTELRDRWVHAHNTGDVNDYADYLDRLELYRADRFERVYKHMPATSRPQTYQDLTLPAADRIAAKEESLRRFKAAKTATTASPSPAAPVLRIAGIKRAPLP